MIVAIRSGMVTGSDEGSEPSRDDCPITCPIWDVIFQDIDMTNADKIRIAPNSRFSEISWYYPTTTSNGEVAKYVKYNTAVGTWDFGSLSRTAWINQSVLGAPIGAGPVGTQNFVYQHEMSPDADGQPMTSSFTTGYSVIAEGEWKSFVDQVWPDMKWGYYGSAQDADRLRAALVPGGRLLIVGAGLIGAEVASPAMHLGCHVTIVDPVAAPLAAIVGDGEESLTLCVV